MIISSSLIDQVAPKLLKHQMSEAEDKLALTEMELDNLQYQCSDTEEECNILQQVYDAARYKQLTQPVLEQLKTYTHWQSILDECPQITTDNQHVVCEIVKHKLSSSMELEPVTVTAGILAAGAAVKGIMATAAFAKVLIAFKVLGKVASWYWGAEMLLMLKDPLASLVHYLAKSQQHLEGQREKLYNAAEQQQVTDAHTNAAVFTKQRVMTQPAFKQTLNGLLQLSEIIGSFDENTVITRDQLNPIISDVLHHDLDEKGIARPKANYGRIFVQPNTTLYANGWTISNILTALDKVISLSKTATVFNKTMHGIIAIHNKVTKGVKELKPTKEQEVDAKQNPPMSKQEMEAEKQKRISTVKHLNVAIKMFSSHIRMLVSSCSTVTSLAMRAKPRKGTESMYVNLLNSSDFKKLEQQLTELEQSLEDMDTAVEQLEVDYQQREAVATVYHSALNKKITNEELSTLKAYTATEHLAEMYGTIDNTNREAISVSLVENIKTDAALENAATATAVVAKSGLLGRVFGGLGAAIGPLFSLMFIKDLFVSVAGIVTNTVAYLTKNQKYLENLHARTSQMMEAGKLDDRAISNIVFTPFKSKHVLKHPAYEAGIRGLQASEQVIVNFDRNTELNQDNIRRIVKIFGLDVQNLKTVRTPNYETRKVNPGMRLSLAGWNLERVLGAIDSATAICKNAKVLTQTAQTLTTLAAEDETTIAKIQQQQQQAQGKPQPTTTTPAREPMDLERNVNTASQSAKLIALLVRVYSQESRIMCKSAIELAKFVLASI